VRGDAAGGVGLGIGSYTRCPKPDTRKEVNQMSYMVKMRVGGVDYVGNGLRFSTEEEARDYGVALAGRWTVFRDWVVECDHQYNPSRSCGVNVCYDCLDHEGLALCFCGWARSGGDGRRQLEEMGENIEEE